MSENEKPVIQGQGADGALATTDVGAPLPVKSGSATEKKDIQPVETLVEFLERFLERKGKILAQDKKVFDLLERNFGEENREAICTLFLEKDKDLKYCLALSDFLLDGSIQSSNRIELLHFIERVLSDYQLLGQIKSRSILQTWLSGSSDVSDKLGFFESNFRNQSRLDEKGKIKSFSDSQIATLLCISAVWLYFKGESDFFTLTRCLSKSAFSTEGKSNNYIEAQAFGFATSMISSIKKKGFAYFLQMVSETEKSLSSQLQAKSLESSSKTHKIKDLEEKTGDLERQLASQLSDKNTLVNEIGALKTEVSSHQVKARHRDTHHQDSKDDLRIKLMNVLEGELAEVLGKAKKAHSKAKHDVVEYQINDALEILERELGRLREGE